MPMWVGPQRVRHYIVNNQREADMGFADAFKKNAEKHVDTPAQAEARAAATAELKSKAEAKAARAAAAPAGKKAEPAAPVATAPKPK